MYKAKPFLDKDCLLSQYFSYIYSCIKYANLAWTSTHKTNLRKIHNHQKYALKIVYNNDRYYHIKEHFRSRNILNVYKLKKELGELVEKCKKEYEKEVKAICHFSMQKVSTRSN